jgi:hypothetical protein
MPTNAEPSSRDSCEIITPASVPNKRIWVTPAALATLLDECEAQDGHCQRLTIWLFAGDL